MKSLIFLVSSIAFLGFLSAPQSGRAQSPPFALTNARVEFSTIQASGASSRHQLTFSISGNGHITGRGKRFDYTANSSSPSPAAGVNVTIGSRGVGKSLLGRPTLSTNILTEASYYSPGAVSTNVAVLASYPLRIFLSDGAVLHGTIYRGIATTRYAGQQTPYSSTNVWAKAAATHKAGFSGEIQWSLPGNLSFSNPFGRD